MNKLTALMLFAALASCDGSDVPSGSPYNKQSAETFSMQLKPFRTIDSQKNLHWFQDYVSGYREPADGQVPSSITTLKVSSGCALPKPKPGSKLVEIITWNSKKYSPLYAIDKQEIEKIAKNFMGVVDNGNNPGLAIGKPEGRLQPIDVAVTETSGPVHLVLASRNDVLWNLMAAPDAQITGITIISSSRVVAIAHAPSGIAISALTGDMAEKCGVKPSLMPVKEYPGVKMQLHRANDNDAKYAEMMAKYRAYNSFFRKQFGVDSDDVSIGVSVMNHAVVGPVPADTGSRIPFTTTENAEIKITPAAFVFFGSETDYVAAKKATIIQAASKLSGKNYETVIKDAGY